MPFTIDLSPEVEKRLREIAADRGVDAEAVARKTLEDQLSRQIAEPSITELSESQLLQKINLGVVPDIWARYDVLRERRATERLTPAEQRELVGISDQIEQANARRMPYLIELSRRSSCPVESLIARLGINGAAHE